MGRSLAGMGPDQWLTAGRWQGQALTGRRHDRLARVVGADNVLTDVDTIPVALTFRLALSEAVR